MKTHAGLAERWQIEMKKGYAKPLILKILSRGENYPYQLTKEINEISGGQISIATSNIYPILRDLKNSGLIDEITSENSRRIFYQLSDKGINLLDEIQTQMVNFVDLIQFIFKENEGKE